MAVSRSWLKQMKLKKKNNSVTLRVAVHHGNGRSAGFGAAWSDLFVHDGREFGQQVPVVRSHLLLVLQLVLLDQPLVHIQGLAARFRKLPAGGQ